MAAQDKTNMPSEHAVVMEHLNELINSAHNLIEDKDISLAEARRIAGYITEIRQLLSEWADIERRLVPARPIAEIIRVLKDQSFELEGLIKESRNRLERELRLTKSTEKRKGMP